MRALIHGRRVKLTRAITREEERVNSVRMSKCGGGTRKAPIKLPALKWTGNDKK